MAQRVHYYRGMKPEIEILEALSRNPVPVLKLDRLVFCNGLSIRCESLINLGLIERDTDDDYPTCYLITCAGLAVLENVV